MKFPEIQVVVHDWDDTVAATYRGVVDTLQDYARERKLLVPEEAAIRQLWGHPREVIWSGLWPEMDFSRPDVKLPLYLPQLFPGITETLTLLLQQAIRLGILSSAPREVLIEGIARLGIPLSDYDIVHGREDTPVHKPSPHVFDGIVDYFARRGIPAHDIAYTGDHITDYQAARDSGLLFIAVTTGFTTRTEFLQQGVPEDHILNSFADLPRILLQ